MNRYSSTPLLRTFTSHLRQKLAGGSGGGGGSAGKGRRASEFTGVGAPTSSPGPSSVVGTPASSSQPNLNPTTSSASASSSTTNTLSHHLTVGSSASSVPRSRSMNELFGNGGSVLGKRASVRPHGERTPPLAAAAARSRDESVAAARKIQTWWRMRQMRLHFSHILKRAGSGASIVAAQRPPGSRGSSGDDPLRRGTRHYVLLFNQDPREAVEAMRSGPLATYSPDEADDHLVEFLRRNTLTLDKTRIGELFGLPDPPIQRLLHAYMASLPLDHLGLSDALRAALATFRLPGEAQKIDRILDAWARAYCAANPGTYRDPTTAFVLAFSVIMLNTDAHNPAVKKKMTLAEFIRNNRGIDAGGNVPEATLRRLYYDIKCCAIRMQDRADPGEMAVVKAIAGVENSRSKLVAEFIAFKVIKGAKHERFVFLFKDVLVITKQKPGPKYLINHQWPIQAVTVYPASNSSSDYDFPHSVYLGYDDEADDSSPMAGTGGSAGSGGVGSTSDLSDRVHLAFSTPEEHEVFLKQLSVAKVEQSKQHEALTDYLANRVARTKSTLERRYRSVSEDPAAAAPHLTRDPSSPPSRPSTPPTTQLFTSRHLSTSPNHDNPPPLVVSPPPPPPPTSSNDDIDATAVPLPRSPTAPLSSFTASTVNASASQFSI
ncbi:hypothetical protein AMAG_17261 [Allomyces macrogynus ATCC 38327]|uniref:SEC7 domain-containing protein n=1 Tax=Allomyces macrogynus (strain ATCC 38327) TaxID=578462 RepID=A0A0L0TEM3_ALLM3|nr:hypothetical protein AMAG_17261 [Allomyces macrogynus ATCC 38327]|eukprot:KNE73111.1 hypothetical protein AMAG_17261 [Allomyces macrogynus ATCC 38327]